MFSLVFLEKGLGIVSPQNYVYGFPKKLLVNQVVTSQILKLDLPL